MDSGKAQAVLDAARHSMGMEVSDIDLLNIDSFAMRVVSLSDYRKQLHQYVTPCSDFLFLSLPLSLCMLACAYMCVCVCVCVCVIIIVSQSSCVVLALTRCS